MIQAAPKLMTFEEFVEWHPDDGRIFELIEGEVVELNPTGPHEKLAGLLAADLIFEIRRQQLAYFIPRTCTVKPHREKAGYKPDVAVLDEESLKNEPRWLKESTIINGASVRIAIEVVSTNWRDDYGLKLSDYEDMGIPEYWIVDYRALGAVRYIGEPKQPTISIYVLKDGEYQQPRQFRRSDRIESPTFPELQLTAEEVFRAGR